MCFEFKRIDVEEVLKLLTSLDINKAPDLDSIGSKTLKMVAHEISPRLISLFSYNVQKGNILALKSFCK